MGRPRPRGPYRISLRSGQVVAEAGQFLEGWAGGVPHVKTAGSGPCAQGLFDRETGNQSEAEPGVEVIAGSSGQLRLIDQRPFEETGFDRPIPHETGGGGTHLVALDADGENGGTDGIRGRVTQTVAGVSVSSERLTVSAGGGIGAGGALETEVAKADRPRLELALDCPRGRLQFP